MKKKAKKTPLPPRIQKMTETVKKPAVKKGKKGY